MNQKIRMLQSLGAMLQPGETLMHPIYGILQEGGVQYFSFFGLTEKFLLIAVLSMDGTSVTHTIRVPLDVKSVKVKTTPVMRQRVIDIIFNEEEPCHIIAAPRVLIIDSQKDNLPRFVEYLEQRATGTPAPDLRKIPGTKFRRQYFNIFIGIVLSFLPTLLVFEFYSALKESSFVFSEIVEGIAVSVFIVALLLLPFVILSLLNRILFGKIVCVANEEGLHLENDFIPWENVEEIVYNPRLPSGAPSGISYATVAVKAGADTEYGIDVMHFPLYGLKKLKKHKPDLKTSIGKGGGAIAFVALMPTAMALILCLLAWL